MNQHILDLLANVVILQKQSFKNLTVVPFSYKATFKLDYIGLDEALERNLIEINEISEGGSVPDLQVLNKSDFRVILFDGEELAGAKQNRVLNATILIDKQTKVKIPVSCVEQNRWSYENRNFNSSGNSMPVYSRSIKMRSVSDSLNNSEGKSFRSDQGEVWDEVNKLSFAANVSSRTNAMKDVFESKDAEMKIYVENFKKLDEQNGFFVFINGKIAGMEFISNDNVFKKIFEKLIKGYAMDALTKQDTSNDFGTDILISDFVERIKATGSKQYKSVGLGDDNRFDTPDFSGSALIYDSEIIHFATLSRLSSGSTFKTRDFIRRNMR